MQSSRNANRNQSFAAVIALALAVTAAETAAEDPLSEFAAASSVSIEELVNDPLPKQFCLSESVPGPMVPSLERALEQSLPGHAITSKDSALGLEHSDGALDRLLATGRLSLLTLMRTESTRVFFGVNEDGRVGVHFDGTSLLAPE